jgi:hypothetical protein
MQINKPCLKVLLVVMPRNTINSRRRLPPEREKRLPQKIDVDVV